jgi:hypothetical protein
VRSRAICCAWCKGEKKFVVFDIRECSHFLNSNVWNAFLSAFAEYGAAEAEKDLESRENSLITQMQSLKLRLVAQKEQGSLTERQSIAVLYIQNNLIIPECPYRSRNTRTVLNNCGYKFTPDIIGCAHITVRFYRRVKPVSVTDRIPVPRP